MSSVNSVRIPGLATGMDTDAMVKEMLTGDQSKIDKVDQKKQTSTWQQESYREIITNVKGFYDKYFSATSPDFILSSKVFGTTTVTSSNNNIISANAGAGANKVDYKFKVEEMAKPAKLESIIKDSEGKEIKLDKNKTFGDLNLIKTTEVDADGKPVEATTTIKINDKEIEISSNDKVSDVVSKINKEFSDGSVKATYSEMTGKLSIETKKTGTSSELKFEGELFENLGMSDGTEVKITGSNNKVEVYANDGKTLLNTIEEESNTFTIDNITYSVNSTSNDLVSMSSTTDTKQTVDKMKSFLDEYNKMVDEVYKNVTEKKNKDYPPLTAAQKEEMNEEEIEKWETKAKVGLLRNDKELRTFMDDIKSAIFGTVGDTGLSLSDIGIKSDEDYNKPGQLQLDVDKFTKALEENGDMVYKVTTGAFEKVKDVVYKNVGSSSGALVKKAGIEKSSTTVNNLFSQQIKKQEEQIKALTAKMQDKESALYKKFARLESSMNKFNAQMSTLTGLMGQ